MYEEGCWGTTVLEAAAEPWGWSIVNCGWVEIWQKSNGYHKRCDCAEKKHFNIGLVQNTLRFWLLCQYLQWTGNGFFDSHNIKFLSDKAILEPAISNCTFSSISDRKVEFVDVDGRWFW